MTDEAQVLWDRALDAVHDFNRVTTGPRGTWEEPEYRLAWLQVVVTVAAYREAAMAQGLEVGSMVEEVRRVRTEAYDGPGRPAP